MSHTTSTELNGRNVTNIIYLNDDYDKLAAAADKKVKTTP